MSNYNHSDPRQAKFDYDRRVERAILNTRPQYIEENRGNLYATLRIRLGHFLSLLGQKLAQEPGRDLLTDRS